MAKELIYTDPEEAREAMIELSPSGRYVVVFQFREQDWERAFGSMLPFTLNAGVMEMERALRFTDTVYYKFKMVPAEQLCLNTE